nr:stromal cell-derived factor 2 [Ciona intestinalis]|eukprot:XP_002129076.1 stromal cell-derived factor 2 [Ciona intestinalis]
MSRIRLLLGFIFALLNSSALGLEYDFVTSGSVTKLMNKVYTVRLHSHDVKYGSGSGQQSVTGMNSQNDANSYWQVRSPTDEHITRGTPIKCGQSIRLTHINTNTNLHSHHFKAPLSKEQEVSAFGTDGEGDHLDNWVVVCSGKYWKRNNFVRFQHKETKAYLTCSDQVFGRPIHGQQEVMATLRDDTGSANYWKSMEGVFLKPTETPNKN